MTVNRASAISVKRELLPVLWVQLKAVVFNVLVPPSFEKRKNAETNYLEDKKVPVFSSSKIFHLEHEKFLPGVFVSSRTTVLLG